MTDSLAGTGRLLRLALHRDRVLLPVWMLALVLSCVSSVRATVDLYPDAASRAKVGQGVNDNPALVAFYGPIADIRSAGGVSTFKLLLLGGAFVAMLCALLVRRHLRLEEESGRAELLASTVVGRHALLAAGVGEAILAAALTGILTALGNIASGLDVPGSLAFGMAWTGLGLSATGVAAVACQLSASTRTAGGIIAGVLGAAYVLRAVGDVSAPWLSWLSPFGWASRLQAYGAERWWVGLLPLLLCVVLLAWAVRLADRRDVGAGLFPERPGPALGRLGSVAGLELRLHRAGLIGWSAALLALGAVLGGIAPSVDSMLSSPSARAMLQRVGGTGALIDTFLATEIAFVAVGVTAFAIGVVVRAGSEEGEGRTEALLATATSRSRLFETVAGLALAGPILLLLAFAVGASLSFGLQQGGFLGALGRLLPAALVQLPAIWVLVAVALLLFGLSPRWAAYAWAVLGLCLLLGQIGELVGLPSWVVGISPYGHVPRLPGGRFDLAPELLMFLLAMAVFSWAISRYRQRDVG